MAGGTYLRISLYVLMIHFKKFGAFICSVPISRLSNRTIDIELNICNAKSYCESLDHELNTCLGHVDLAINSNEDL